MEYLGLNKAKTLRLALRTRSTYNPLRKQPCLPLCCI